MLVSKGFRKEAKRIHDALTSPSDVTIELAEPQPDGKTRRGVTVKFHAPNTEAAKG